MRKLLTLLFIGALLCTACNNKNEKVEATWPDGSRQLVKIYNGKGEDAKVIGERRYYLNGTLQYEKHFDADHGYADGLWTFYHPNGKPFATGDFSKDHQLGDNWNIFDSNGNNYYKQHFDSVRVIELGEHDTPASIIYYDSTDRHLFQFFSNGNLRCTGMTRNGLREGPWTFYHPNGLPQLESHFLEGKENGLYVCYRENGIPYYRGAYINGLRAGNWEFYDENGNLAEVKGFDENAH